MAYNNRNKLKKIIAVQALYNSHKQEGVTTVHIFRTYIAPTYHISQATFYNYLATPAKKMLDNPTTKSASDNQTMLAFQ